jgi:phosphotransacetylase
MSGFESFIPMAATAASSLMSTSSKADSQNAAITAQNDATNQRNQMIATQQAQQDQQQRNLLEQQQATARAQMGAWGTAGDGGGSADAILAGMAQRTADSIANGDQMVGLRQNHSNLLSSNSSNPLVPNGLDVFQSFYGSGGNTALSMLD